MLDSPKPPAKRITLTLPVINHARNVAFVCVGAGKQDILCKILKERDHTLPAAMVCPNGQLTWFLDAEAGKLIKPLFDNESEE